MNSRELYKLSGNNDREMLVDVKGKKVTSFYKNTIVYCTGEYGDEYVAKFPRLPYRAEHEWIGYERADEVGICVPDRIALITDENGQLGILLKRVFGKNLYQTNVEDAKLMFGRLVKKMHEKSDRYEEGGMHDNFTFYDTAVTNLLVSNLSNLVDASYIRGMLRTFSMPVADDLDNRRTVFTHHDLHDDQVIAAEEKLCIIDFEEWCNAHPMEDIAIYLYHCLRTKRPENEFSDFVSGYVSTDQLTESDKLSIAYFLLFQSLKMTGHYAKYRSDEVDFALRYLQRSIDYINNEKIWKM